MQMTECEFVSVDALVGLLFGVVLPPPVYQQQHPRQRKMLGLAASVLPQQLVLRLRKAVTMPKPIVGLEAAAHPRPGFGNY